MDKEFNKLLIYHLNDIIGSIRNIDKKCTDFELLMALSLKFIDKLLFIISFCDMKNKKEIKLNLLDNISNMIRTIKEHRLDLNMEDND